MGLILNSLIRYHKQGGLGGRFKEFLSSYSCFLANPSLGVNIKFCKYFVSYYISNKDNVFIYLGDIY